MIINPELLPFWYKARMKKLPLLVVFTALISTTCTKKETAPPTAPAAPAANVATSLDNIGSATLEGAVTYLGTPPKAANNPAASMKDCAADKSDPNQWAVRVKDKKLMNAFVYVKSGLSVDAYPAPAGAVELDQKHCAYLPRVLGLQVGQPLAILNSDATLHNVHSLAKESAGFNAGMPTQGMRITKIFDKPEVMVALKCDVHPWMRAYVGVLPHPFHAVTKEDGSFSIPNLPAGTFTVAVWHETLGTLEQTLTVAAGEKKAASFEFAADAKAAK